jgi:hypothetical protein
MACSKKEVPNYSGLLGLDYYPLEAGKYIIYQVDSTVFTEIPKDTINYAYQVKEKIADSYIDEKGMNAIRLERYVKWFNPNVSYDQLAWKIKDVWVIRASDKQIEVQESNVRFVKLIFPIQEKATWNGNAANTLGQQAYIYDSIENPEVINQLYLDKVLKVKQLDNVNLIEGHLASEKFAKGIGLVAKFQAHVKGNTVQAGKTVFERIESGLIYKQVIVEHGIE